jgi:cytochrome P450
VWGDDLGKFRPGSFLTDDWPQQAFLPYGAGRHLCIGSDFADAKVAILPAMML